MSLGIQPSLAQLNSQIGAIALTFRNACDGVNYMNDYLQALGTDGLTAAPLNMTSGDATALLIMFNNLAQVTGAAEGEAYNGPPLPFNFVQSTVSLWGGQ